MSISPNLHLYEARSLSESGRKTCQTGKRENEKTALPAREDRLPLAFLATTPPAHPA